MTQINGYEINNGSEAELRFPPLCFQIKTECFKPIFDGLPYDYVIRNKKKQFKTVQIKQAYYKKGNKTKTLIVDIRKGNGNSKVCYDSGDFDLLAVYDKYQNQWWFIQWAKIKKMRELRINHDKWNQFKVLTT